MTNEEKTPYHKIMVDAWRIFIKERKAELFSDEWWEEIINEYDVLREPYKNTELDSYLCSISMVFLDEYERKSKHARQKRISEELLSAQQEKVERTVQELQDTNKMDGFEEVVEPFT